MNQTITAAVVCATAIWIGLLVASFAPPPASSGGSWWQPSMDSKLVRGVRPHATTGAIPRPAQ